MTQYEPADRMPEMYQVHEALKWLYSSSEKLENPNAATQQYYLYCDYNESLIHIPQKQVLRVGKDEIIQAGKNHDYDGHLINGLVPNNQNMCQMQFYLDGDNLFIQDQSSKMGTFLSNLTMPNQQIYNDIPIKGISNCFIPLNDKNLNHCIIGVPFIAPDGITYRIQFKIIVQ
jgi:hypothetical protein